MRADTRIERAYRDDAPRILGAVARTTGDLLLAEEAVQEAFARALAEAARGREPANPAAWITTVARRVALDALRRERTAVRAAPALAAEAARDADVRHAAARAAETTGGSEVFTGDERLQLILLVAHPDLAPAARVALALRFVCGVPTGRIADAFLVSEPTMAARLTRAKKRIHDSGIRFRLDDPGAVVERMPDALTTIHLLYSCAHTAVGDDARTDDRLRADAIELARDAHRVAPGSESAGLLGLLLLTEARQPTRFTVDGDFATLREADRSRWDAALIAEGERYATVGLAGDGRFGLQAGIAGLHAIAPTWAATDWPAIVRLYDGLVRLWPSPAARLGRIVALGHSPDAGPEAALGELAADPGLGGGALAQQVHAARAELLRLAGRPADAAVELRLAVDTARDDRTERSLRRLLTALD
ncbi:sigma-70 family RNA polymerase sigma factor [Leifsonia sp. F6_8S_P_1B]|uniref:Sigma-70 family RNA polymerase sigma factor n=1 Tax=Leifsonia williamsii TaxID=3035919 RepID=A0ABT8KBT8_9MICO|nr:sigma-70 family RNA polymerase sigma factor [Leifsonia williamsii]MDN4614920.1 sigma-70 family RNA polymerase sigma factor [Leifsonia williamsii]